MKNLQPQTSSAIVLLHWFPVESRIEYLYDLSAIVTYGRNQFGRMRRGERSPLLFEDQEAARPPYCGTSSDSIVLTKAVCSSPTTNHKVRPLVDLGTLDAREWKTTASLGRHLPGQRAAVREDGCVRRRAPLREVQHLTSPLCRSRVDQSGS